jgi:hypothetical protein
MIVALDFDYQISPKSLLVKIEFPGNHVVLDLNQQVPTVYLEFDLPICNQTINLTFSCNNLCIVDYPLTIANIVLDEFYQSNGIVYQGHPKFDQQFMLLADQKSMYLDHTVNDCNRLDFTGQLEYKFDWPFYKNIFQ